MRISWLIGASALALALYSVQNAHANYIEIVNGQVTLGIGSPKLTSGTFDLADPDWSFENDPNWRTEIVPCPLVPWILGEYVAWETTYNPPAPPPIDPPPVIDPPPCFDCDPPPPCLTCGGSTPAVPEPSTWAMMLLGFAGIAFASLRRRFA